MLLSVAMTVFNGGEFLQSQLQSLFDQELLPDEIVICDDGSTDGSLDVLREWASRESRIHLVENNEWLGPAGNFCKAISLCKGELVALCDQDDIWEESKLKKQVAALGNADLVFCDSMLMDEKGESLEKTLLDFARLKFLDHMDYRFQLLRNYIQGCTMLCRRSLLEQVLPFPEGVKHHDWWIGLSAFALGDVRFCNQALLRYRLHSNNEVGIISRGGLLRSIGSTWNKLFHRSNHPRVVTAEYQLIQLSALEESSWLPSDWRPIIRDLLAYYGSYTKGLIHFDSLRQGFRHYPIIHEDSRWRLRMFKDTLGDFLG